MSARTKAPRQHRPGKYRIWAAIAVALASCLVAAAYWFAGPGTANRRPALPPEIDLSQADPAVARAVTEARQAVLDNPNSAAAWGQLGLHLIGHRFSTDTAVNALSEAERLDPRDARWPYQLAEALETSDPARAVDKLRRTVELLGDQSDVPRFRLAELLLALDRFDEAATALDALSHAGSASPRAELDRARLALRRGDLDETIRHSQQSQADPHTRKAALLLAAQTFARLEQADMARDALTAAGKLPNDLPWPDPWRQAPTQLRTGERVGLARAARLLVDKQPVEASRRIREVLAEHPGSPLAWLLLGRCLMAQDKFVEAQQALAEAVKLDPQAAEAQFYLGVDLYLQQRIKESAGCFERAVEIDPAFAPAWHNLANCRQDLHDRSGAADAFLAALRAKPDYAAAHEDFGLLLADEGQTEAAKTHLRAALELNPASKVARDRLRQLEGPQQAPGPASER